MTTTRMTNPTSIMQVAPGAMAVEGMANSLRDNVVDMFI